MLLRWSRAAGQLQNRTFEDEFFKILQDFEVEIEQKKMFDFFLPD